MPPPGTRRRGRRSGSGQAPGRCPTCAARRPAGPGPAAGSSAAAAPDPGRGPAPRWRFRRAASPRAWDLPPAVSGTWYAILYAVNQWIVYVIRSCKVPVFAGQGDPARSMALLWRTPGPRTGPGPKQGLSVDAIVAAAIAVADTDGLAGLSMRAVAERLGVTAMALYTYVPGKEELVDLMYDGAHAELPVHYDLGKGWRAAVTSWASNLLGCYLGHPWTLQVSFARPVLGPNEQTVLEALARVLRQAG